MCFLAFDGHCYMYRAVKQVLERQAACVLCRDEARRPCRPSESGGALTPRTCSLSWRRPACSPAASSALVARPRVPPAAPPAPDDTGTWTRYL